MKYFILFHKPGMASLFLERNQITNDEFECVCSMSDMKHPDVEKALLEADKRVIISDFHLNPDAKEIVMHLLGIMEKRGSIIDSQPLWDYANKTFLEASRWVITPKGVIEIEK